MVVGKNLFLIRINSKNPFQEELDYMHNLWGYWGKPHEHCFWAVWLGNVCGGWVLLGARWWFGRLIGHRMVGELSSVNLDACNLVTLNRCSSEMDSLNFVGPVNAMGMSVCVWIQVCSQSHGYLIAFTGWLSWSSDHLFFIRINSKNPFQEELDYMHNLWSY
jgi:hypothetical protein